jgi:hypothetical protein
MGIMIDRTRRMREYRMPKGNAHDYMQVYTDDATYGIVSFYHGARASVDTVPEFADYQTSFSVCAFYRMPYSVIEAYLKSVGTE